MYNQSRLLLFSLNGITNAEMESAKTSYISCIPCLIPCAAYLTAGSERARRKVSLWTVRCHGLDQQRRATLLHVRRAQTRSLNRLIEQKHQRSLSVWRNSKTNMLSMHAQTWNAVGRWHLEVRDAFFLSSYCSVPSCKPLLLQDLRYPGAVGSCVTAPARKVFETSPDTESGASSRHCMNLLAIECCCSCVHFSCHISLTSVHFLADDQLLIKAQTLLASTSLQFKHDYNAMLQLKVICVSHTLQPCQSALSCLTFNRQACQHVL